MKKIRNLSVFLMLSFLITICSCTFESKEERKNDNNGIMSEKINNISTNVKIEVKNTKTDAVLSKTNYKLFIDGNSENPNVRMDFEIPEINQKYSVYSNKNVALTVNTNTNQIINENNVDNDEKIQLLEDLLAEKNLGKVNLSKIRKLTKDFDKEEDKKINELKIFIPNDYFNTETEERQLTEIKYDTKKEIIKSIKTVTKQKDESILKISSYFEYEDTKKGEYIKKRITSYIECKNEKETLKNYELTQIQEFNDIEINSFVGNEFETMNKFFENN